MNRVHDDVLRALVALRPREGGAEHVAILEAVDLETIGRFWSRDGTTLLEPGSARRQRCGRLINDLISDQ